MAGENAFESIFRAKIRAREARAELLASLLFAGSMLLSVITQVVLADADALPFFPVLRVFFFTFLGVTAVLSTLAYLGIWHPSLSFLNVAAQNFYLGFFLSTAAATVNAEFALTTAAPMFLVLVVCLTAFRMNPWLSLFAGAAGCTTMVVSYLGFMAPTLTPEILATNPAMAYPAVISRAIVLLAAGAACAIAADTMRRHLQARSRDEDRIELLERTFGRLLAPEVARRILDNDDWMKPERRDAVVMFADLKGFTHFAENRDPEEVADLLNECWTRAAAIVEEHGGVINKFLGDGFLALFGVPADHQNPELAAANTAGALQQSLTPFLESHGLALCIGIHAGPLIFGGIGSESRCEFTVIGTTVNVASRVESLNRSLDTRSLTTSPVAEKLGDSWNVHHRGEHQVKGIGSKFGVFEIRKGDA